jgi:hypothetical protein
MNITEFNMVTWEQVQRCLEVLAKKGREYAPGEDRLEQFKVSAENLGVTPKMALWGMAAKHLTSLNLMCKNDSHDVDMWTEKITDAINYLLLLNALVREEEENEKHTN